jgi:hypothetical protein
LISGVIAAVVDSEVTDLAGVLVVGCWSGEMRERLLGEDKEAGKFKLKISEFK